MVFLCEKVWGKNLEFSNAAMCQARKSLGNVSSRLQAVWQSTCILSGPLADWGNSELFSGASQAPPVVSQEVQTIVRVLSSLHGAYDCFLGG
jgi:hypothetical protein